MGLLFSERRDLSNIWYWTVVIALAFASMGVADQKPPSSQTSVPLAAQEKVAPDTPPTAEDAEIVSAAAAVETQYRFDELRNELRRELLDDRANTINWWLNIILIVLGFLSVVAAAGVYLGLSSLREIKDEAKKSAGEVREIVKEINEQKKRADEDVAYISGIAEQQSPLSLNIEDSTRDDAPLSILLDRGQHRFDITQEAEEAVRDIRRNPEASLLARAIADAYSLQRAGKIEEAIEKWRSIANVAEGSDNDLAARAWLSVGYLLYERGGEDAGEQ